MVHSKQLCLLCLQHPLSVGCEVAGKGFCCLAEGCDRPHHATLHEVLKAGEPSPPGRKAVNGREYFDVSEYFVCKLLL
jgi:hypothetical protein